MFMPNPSKVKAQTFLCRFLSVNALWFYTFRLKPRASNALRTWFVFPRLCLFKPLDLFTALFKGSLIHWRIAGFTQVILSV
jgi:hypothetical protein